MPASVSRRPEGTPLDHVREILAEHLPSFDVGACEAVLSTVVANQLTGPAIWLMLIAPPSSGKTMILEPLIGVRQGYLELVRRDPDRFRVILSNGSLADTERQVSEALSDLFPVLS